MVRKINKKENLEGKRWNRSTEGKEMFGKVKDADEKGCTSETY